MKRESPEVVLAMQADAALNSLRAAYPAEVATIVSAVNTLRALTELLCEDNRRLTGEVNSLHADVERAQSEAAELRARLVGGAS